MAGYGWWCYYKSTSWGKKYRTKSLTQTDRSKSGTKRSILVVDGKGVPIGVYVDGANRQR